MKKEMALPAGKAPAKRRYLPAYLSYQWRLVRKHRQLYVLMLPFVIIFTLFTILPVLLSVVLSLTSYNVLETPKFVGWDNYIRLFMYDDVFPTAVRNTFAFALVTGPASYVLCFFFAWIINDMTPRVRSLLTLVFYAPSISGNLFSIWLLFFSGDMYGYLNSYLMKIGLLQEPVVWLRDPRYMFAIVVIVQLWASLGTSFLSMRAGFTTIDKQYYEAAAVDGIPRPLAGAVAYHSADDGAAPDAVGGAVDYSSVQRGECGHCTDRYAQHQLRDPYAADPYDRLRYHPL